MAIVKNAVKAMEASMTPEHIHRALAEAEREILAIRLAELRVYPKDGKESCKDETPLRI